MTSTKKIKLSDLTEQEKYALRKELEAEEKNKKAQYAKDKAGFENDRDAFLEQIHNDAVAIQEMLQEFKYVSLSKSDSLQEKVLEFTNSSRKNLHNYFLQHSNGNLKVDISTKAKPVYDETFKEGIAFIEEWISDTIKEADKTLATIVRRLLKTNKENHYNSNKLLELIGLEQEIAHPKFTKGVEIIKDSFKNGETKRYIRFKYKTKSGGWEHLSLQFSALDDDYESNHQPSEGEGNELDKLNW